MEHRYRATYRPGEALYRQREQPTSAAHLVVDTCVHEAPRVLVDRRPAALAAPPPPG